VTLNLLGALDPGGTNVKAAKECSQQSGGKYTIKMTPVSTSADASRELIVRRLAAGDKNIDIVNMDTIWTPEFAEAGWLKQLTGAEQADALQDVLAGPKAAVTWKGKTYGIPLNTNVQLLWYRKDLVPNPPKTWDEMIAMAKKLPAGEGNILEQGQHYEGYVVWFNNLVQSAGGTIVDNSGKPRGSSRRSRRPVAPARRCRRTRKTRGVWRSRPARAPSCSTGRTSTRPAAPTRRPTR
jgi:multiple sugar transport system substrate-binding protein